jgi:hypothetical protein
MQSVWARPKGSGSRRLGVAAADGLTQTAGSAASAVFGA